MIPVNQVILGGDPLLGRNPLAGDIEEQLQLLEKYKSNLESIKNINKNVIPAEPVNKRLLWDEIDLEMNSMTPDQKIQMVQNEEYLEVYNKIQQLVNIEILELVKEKIESSQDGRELLESQLKIVKRLKEKIVDDTNKELELFKKFKQFSKENPDVTYEKFIKEYI